MWHDMLSMDIPAVEKVIRTVVVYLAVYLLLRIVGRRDLAQLNSMDLVVVLLLSNVVQNAVIGPDYSVVGGVLGATVLIAVDAGLVRLRISSVRAWRIFDGKATVLVRNGQYDRRTMRRLGIRPTDVLQVIRRQGGTGPRDAQRVLLEPSGDLLVELRRKRRTATQGDIRQLAARLDRIERHLARLADERSDGSS